MCSRKQHGKHTRIFVTGSTGYIGSRLIPVFHTQGHEVIALAREQSTGKLPAGCRPVVGNALDGESYIRLVEGADTFIQLVGVSHPSPANGPGHLWPYVLVPFYKIAELVPKTRDGALRLGLLRLRELVAALVRAVDEPAKGVRLLSVTEARQLGREKHRSNRRDDQPLYLRC